MRSRCASRLLSFALGIAGLLVTELLVRRVRRFIGR